MKNKGKQLVVIGTQNRPITKEERIANCAFIMAKKIKKSLVKGEELEDIKRYDAAKKKKQSFVDADIAFKKIEAKRKNNN